jgi:Rrf2 family transcriptional regulator, nitric oxide-sensitive transcriptional repressor
MQLTRYTDYGLRTLIALALNAGEWQTVTTLSEAYGISRHHLVKVVARLAERGYVETQRGKGGGMRLARPPAGINLGAVVRDMEAELGVVECLQADGGNCVITPACGLKGLLAQANREFMGVLDRHTLEDLRHQRAPVARLLGIPVVAQRRS